MATQWFPVVVIPEDVPRDLEYVGTKPKFWFRGQNQVDTLFKEARPHTGEDWAEKITSELCSLLGLPHASYDLAAWNKKPGVISCSFIPKGGRLELGNELLTRIIPRYRPRQFFRMTQHTLGRVLAVLESPHIRVPLDWRGIVGITTAVDIFVGYLMFDTWIANQDRHHENWGIVVSPEGTRHLAPSYDHASSLGAIETDQVRKSRLTTRDAQYSITYYVTRARSAFFSSPSSRRALPTIEAFFKAAKRHPSAAKAWLEYLAGISTQTILGFFERLPSERITPVAIEFAIKMLELNQQRLLALHKDLG